LFSEHRFKEWETSLTTNLILFYIFRGQGFGWEANEWAEGADRRKMFYPVKIIRSKFELKKSKFELKRPKFELKRSKFRLKRCRFKNIKGLNSNLKDLTSNWKEPNSNLKDLNSNLKNLNSDLKDVDSKHIKLVFDHKRSKFRWQIRRIRSKMFQ
jgi:predicted transcriptional regulator